MPNGTLKSLFLSIEALLSTDLLCEHASENPEVIVARPLEPTGVIGPYFFLDKDKDPEINVIISTERCERVFFFGLKLKIINWTDMWIQ